MSNVRPQKETSVAGRAPKKSPTSQVETEGKAGSLAQLANLGPKSAQFMQRAGITSFEQLKHLGAVRAYSMVKHIEPSASLNLLWALEGAISGLHWQQVAKEHRTSLLLALETHEQSKTSKAGG
jgi:DNA transformation protein and related proteins